MTLSRTRPLQLVVLILIPLLLESELAHLGAGTRGMPGLVAELAVEGVVTGLIASYVALVEVHTAHALVELGP